MSITLALESMAHGGKAIAHHEGKVFFVAGGIPGETVQAEVVQDQSRYAHAIVTEVLSPSPQRTEPPCPHFGDPIRRWGLDAATSCGGCQWQHIAYPAQLAFKRQIIHNQLAHLGRLPGVTIGEPLGMEEPWAYRNHVQLTTDRAGTLGYLAVDGRSIVPVETCPIMHPLVAEAFAELELDFPELERVSLRAGVGTGDRMVVIQTRGDAAPMIEVDSPLSCTLLLSDGTLVTLVGRPYLEERLAGRTFRVSANAFFQVNTAQAERLVELVAEYLEPGPDDVLLDAYCGVGTFGLALAERVAEVIGVEESSQALADADHNAGDLDNVTLIEGKVEEVLSELEEKVDLAVLDPPRQGCERAVVAALGRLGPRRIAYVSCDPATLARDLGQLSRLGYRVVQVQPVDLFPQTYHIESVTLLVHEG